MTLKIQIDFRSQADLLRIFERIRLSNLSTKQLLRRKKSNHQPWWSQRSQTLSPLRSLVNIYYKHFNSPPFVVRASFARVLRIATFNFFRQESGAGHLFADYCEILPESTSAIQLYRLSKLHRPLQSTRSGRRPGSVRRSCRRQMLRIGIAVFVHAICAEVWQAGTYSAM